MTDFRREALINTLRADYGITTVEELLEGIRTMAKVDISQFVLRPKERNIHHDEKRDEEAKRSCQAQESC